MKSLLSILVISISVGVYLVYIKPLAVDVRVQIAKKEEIEKVLNRVKEIKDKRDSVFEDYNAISSKDIEKLNKIIPEEVNTVEILNDLSSVASQYGLSVTEYKAENELMNNSAVSESDGAVSETFKKTHIIFNLKGQYAQFVEFLETIESSLRIVDIVQLGIKGGSSSGPATSLEYTIHATVYSLK